MNIPPTISEGLAMVVVIIILSIPLIQCLIGPLLGEMITATACGICFYLVVLSFASGVDMTPYLQLVIAGVSGINMSIYIMRYS